jgi:hypothetical protein
MMHGLNKDKNFCVSFPWVSLYCTARPPRAASSSTDLIAAAPASSCQTTLNKLHESAFVLTIKVMDVRNKKAHIAAKQHLEPTNSGENAPQLCMWHICP